MPPDPAVFTGAAVLLVATIAARWLPSGTATAAYQAPEPGAVQPEALALGGR